MLRSIDIDFTGKNLLDKRLFHTKKIPFTKIDRIEIRLMRTLFDEIGVIIFTDKGEFFMRETHDQFNDVCKYFDVTSKLAKDWYWRAEHGEIFSTNPSDN